MRWLKYISTFILFLSAPKGYAQNLVSNHDFSVMLDTCIYNDSYNWPSVINPPLDQAHKTDRFKDWFSPKPPLQSFFSSNYPWLSMPYAYAARHRCSKAPVDTIIYHKQCTSNPSCPKVFSRKFPPPVEGDGYAGLMLQEGAGFTIPFNYFYYDPCCSSTIKTQPYNNYSSVYNLYFGVDISGDSRSFIETKLLQPLVPLVDYTVEFYVNRRKRILYTPKQIAAYLSTDTFHWVDHINQVITPQVVVQDTLKYQPNHWREWTHIKGSFVANGGEKFLTLGNFDSTGTGTRGRLIYFDSKIDTNDWFWSRLLDHYFFDAVYVYKSTDSLYSVQLPADTTLCFGDTLRLHAQHSNTFKLEATKRFRWSTGSLDSSITISQPGTYWVEVSYNNRWRQYDTIVVKYIPPYYSGLPRDTVICKGSSLELSVPMQHNVSHRWSTGATGTQVVLTQEGDYTLESYNECDTFVSKIQVRYFPTPEASLPMDTILCAKDSVKLSVPFYTYASYYWSNGSTKPWATYRQEGFASLSLRTHCDTLELMTLIREDDCYPPPVYVPNSFSPNGDGLNDTWYIEGLPAQNELIVINRWGEQIFKASPYQNNWDGRMQNGKMVTPGIYTYILRYSGLIGRDETKAGWLIVLGN